MKHHHNTVDTRELQRMTDTELFLCQILTIRCPPHLELIRS